MQNFCLRRGFEPSQGCGENKAALLLRFKPRTCLLPGIQAALLTVLNGREMIRENTMVVVPPQALRFSGSSLLTPRFSISSVSESLAALAGLKFTTGATDGLLKPGLTDHMSQMPTGEPHWAPRTLISFHGFPKKKKKANNTRKRTTNKQNRKTQAFI